MGSWIIGNRLSKNNTETVAEHGFRSELWCVVQLPNYEAAANSPCCCVTPRHTACTFSCFAIKSDLSSLSWSAGLTSKGCFNTRGREMWPNGSTPGPVVLAVMLPQLGTLALGCWGQLCSHKCHREKQPRWPWQWQHFWHPWMPPLLFPTHATPCLLNRTGQVTISAWQSFFFL